MHNVIDEALQRLYWASREGRGVPGIVPDESSGRVSTDAILQGLGLSPPALERIGSSGRSDSTPDGTEPSAERSYQPPDLQSEDSCRAPAAPSGPAPLSLTAKNINTMVDGMSSQAQRGGQRPSRTVADGEQLNAPLRRRQQVQEAVDMENNPSMLQDGHVSLMDLDPAVYPDVNANGFQGGGQLDGFGQRPSIQMDYANFHSQGMTDGVSSSSSPAGWGSGQDKGEMLPWPGNMVAMNLGSGRVGSNAQGRQR